MEYRVLGPLEVSGPDGRITLEGRRERAVLAALIMARGEVLSTDRLLDAVWGDSPPRSAAKSVQNHVLRLRKVLGAEAIETREPGYCIAVEPGAIDASRFETLIRAGRVHSASGDHGAAIDSLRSALALWRGRPLQELEHYDDAVAEAARLGELHRTASEELVEAELACGRHGEAVAELEALVAVEPLRERRWAMLMLALYRSGRQADALRTYQRARTLLGDELGIEPGPELRALEVAVATQDPSLDLAARRNGDRPSGDDDGAFDPTAEPPYKGLVPFETEDADLFFGRDGVVGELVARLRTSRFLAVVGASGSGKSSVLRAGVVAAVRGGAFPGSSGWSTTIMTPTAQPERVRAQPRALDGHADAPALLVVDQFEELFTLCRDEVARRAFIASLVAAVDAPTPVTTVVIALRADFYGHCAAYPELRQLVEPNTCLLGPMDAPELMAAIDGPANVAELRLERGLGELIVRDVAHEPGALPLLSHALLETWKRRRGRTLTIEAYVATGGVDGAIATTAESVYEALDPAGQRIARAMFLRLTEPGDGTEDTRRRVALTELVTGGDADFAARILQRLADARLVTVDADGAEVAHEAVIREWPRLRGWLDDDREGLRIHRHVTYAARDWDAMRRDDAELYRGPRLATAREWLARDHDARLTEIETAFLAASVEREADEVQAREEHARAQARTNRRLRALLSGTAIALVVALIAGAFALRQTRRAHDEADTARAATERAAVDGILTASNTLRDENRYLESLLLLEADRIQPSDRTKGALMSALLAEPRLVSTLPVSSAGPIWPLGDGSVVMWTNGRLERWDVAKRAMTNRYRFRDFTAATMSAQGILAVAAHDGAVHFLDANGREVAPPIVLPSETPAWNLAFSPDGSEIATVLGRIAADNTVSPAASVRLFDVATGVERSLPLLGHSAAIGVAVFSPDGTRLITGGNDGRVVVYDTRTGALVATPLDVGSVVVSLAADPIRPRVAVGTGKVDLDVWDLDAGRRLASLAAPSAALGAYSPDGSVLAVDGSNAVHLYAADTLLPTDDRPFGAQSGSGWSVLGPDGRLYVTGRAGPVTVWDPTRDAGPLLTPVPGTPSYLFPMAGGRVVVAPDLEDSITLLDARTLAPLGSPLSPGAAPAVTPALPTTFAASYYDSHRIAVVNRAGVFQLFDVASRAPIGPSIDLGFPSAYAVFSRDLRTIAVGGRAGEVAIIDVAGDAPRLIHRNLATDMNLYVVSLEFDPQGRLYAADESHVYRFAHVRAQQPQVENLEAVARGSAGTAMGMDVTPDGRTIAVGHGGSVDLYDARTLQRLGPSIPSMNAPIAWLAYSRDGRYLVANDSSSNVRLIDTARRRTVGPVWSGLPGAGAVFNHDGRVVGTSTTTSGALLDVDPADWRAAACELAGRNLTAAEWHRYLPGQGPRRPTCAQYR